MGLFTSQGYKVVKSQKKYKVKEVASRQFLGSYEYIKEANDQVRQFNLGKGFNGWTPSFMLERIPVTFSEPFNEEL